MRAVIQRVKKASCTVEGRLTGSIQEGLLVFVGMEEADTHQDMQWLANKLVNLRIFTDDQGLMNNSLQDIGGEMLLISQFTLFAQTKKGNRPSFIKAAKPALAEPLYQEMLSYLSTLMEKPVAAGIFGADMKIELLNDGPVTLIMNTQDKDNF